ncbi:uncharacterized protein LOC125761674 [Anopheles funestus]|uniref:uncharacterized protein LOC125761674 n=1 Tax=Anopheles funestus TaxID=62324 RepID=UPI0020C727BB|nr:uncharacterized protein LOC125761674 [Anopheles funestus]
MAFILLGNKTMAHDDYNIHQWVANIPFECKTIVLFEGNSNATQPNQIGHYFATMSLWNVILIATNLDAVYAFHYGPLRILKYTNFPSYNVLFFDRLQTLQTRHLLAAYMKDIYTKTRCKNILGEDLSLFKLFADTFNLEFYVEEMQCIKSELPVTCFSRYADKDLLINRFFFQQYNRFAVDCIKMEKIAIATPKGRLLTIWEILLHPFQQPVWWILIAICSGFQLLEIIIPTLFTNSIVGLALFGFEKRQLRFTGRTEKITASAFVVMIFLFKCAYEAKLISYITETPREPSALSIEQLRQRNITVYHKHFNTTHMNKLKGMLATYDGDSLVFEGSTIADNINALNIEMMLNDVEGTPYKILDETLFEMLPFFTFQPKIAIRQPFLKYQHRVFEAGLPMHWHQKMLNCYRTHVNELKLKTHSNSMENFIHADKLKPLIMFFSVLWTFATAVFVIEVIVGRRLRSC